jgi:hypothetical protein
MNICLIGGTGRCGTTILKTVFTAHPEVAFIPEWRFTIDPDGLIDFYNTFAAGWSPYLFDVKLRRLERYLEAIARRPLIPTLIQRALYRTRLRHVLPWSLIPPYTDVHASAYSPNFLELTGELIEELTAFRYRGTWTGARAWQASLAYAPPFEPEALAHILGAFFRRVAEDAVRAQGAQHYVDDNTWNTLWFDKMLVLVPEARLVHIYRDPRDVVASYTQQTWTPSDPVQAAQLYRGLIERWWAVREALPPATYREIALEALVAHPKAVLKDLCDFWQIPWDDVLLTTDLSHAHTGRWRRDLTRQQQTQVCDILADALARLEYA